MLFRSAYQWCSPKLVAGPKHTFSKQSQFRIGPTSHALAASRPRLSETEPKCFAFETSCSAFGGRIRLFAKVNQCSTRGPTSIINLHFQCALRGFRNSPIFIVAYNCSFAWSAHVLPWFLAGKIVAALVAAGARFDAQDELCLDTPLHKAIRRGMIDNVKHLMVSGRAVFGDNDE